MKTLKAIVIGCGSRGHGYAKFMHNSDGKYEVVAIADISEGRRKAVREAVPTLREENCYAAWEELLSKPKMADIAVIATLDDLHLAPTRKAIEQGYDILLEKPVAQTAAECAEIALAAEKKGVKILVCHVLRYTDFFGKIKELILQGKLGEIMSVIHVEAVGNRHQSHSYVRGNWHSEEEAAPMLLAKSCHDIDIIQWLVGKPCRQVQSFGSLGYFCAANAPEGAPVRCIDGGCPVEDTCPYNCRKLYYDDKKNGWFRAAAASKVRSIGWEPTDEDVMEALQKTDYGLCVFHANNDVVDHQVVNMQFEGGVTASFTMNAFNAGGRYIRLFGTKGELYANISDQELNFYDFADRQWHKIPFKGGSNFISGGHAGGDEGIICEMYDYMVGAYTGFKAADITTSVKNHLICFAAEKSRHNNTVENVDEFMAGFGLKNEYK